MSSYHSIPNTVQTVEYDEATGLLLWVEDNSAPAWQPVVETPISIFDELLAEIRNKPATALLTDSQLAEADAEALFTDWQR